MNKKKINPLTIFWTFFMWLTIIWMFWLMHFLNWYFKYADTIQDINNTIEWEEKWWQAWRAQLNVFDKQVEKQYQALSRKLWWKYYFNNSSTDTMLIKKTYYLDWQIVTANIIKKNNKKQQWDFKFDDLVKQKKSIESITITAINWEKISWELIFKWEELWADKTWFDVLTTQ